MASRLSPLTIPLPASGQRFRLRHSLRGRGGRHRRLVDSGSRSSCSPSITGRGGDSGAGTWGPTEGCTGPPVPPIIADGLVLLANDQLKPEALLLLSFRQEGHGLEPGGELSSSPSSGKTGETAMEDRPRNPSWPATPPPASVEWEIGPRPSSPARPTASRRSTCRVAEISWEIDGLWDDRTVSSPQLHGELVFGSFGQGPRPGSASSRSVPGRPEGLADARGELVYDVTKKRAPGSQLRGRGRPPLPLDRQCGVVTCLDAATGEVHWRERVGGVASTAPRSGSKGRLYGISKRGEVVVLAASKDFEELGRVDLGEKTFATPAIADGVMVLRTESRLYSLGKAKSK